MDHEFDRHYWDDHWQQVPDDPTAVPESPYLPARGQRPGPRYGVGGGLR